MSKCYKAEDVINTLADQWRFEAEMESPYPPEDIEVWKKLARELYDDLPTIEVEEDCISKHDIWKIIEDNAYWVRYNENSTKKGMTLTGINQALNECPPAIPTVSEDCISREQTIEAIDEVDWYHINSAGELVHGAESNVTALYRAEDIYRAIESVAPSVVPSREEGEWIYIEEPIMDNPYGRYRCSECDIEEPHETDYCPNCGAKMKGADDE